MHGFIREFALPLCWALEHWIKTMSSFSYVVNHTTEIERSCIDTYRGGRKRTCNQYNTIVISSMSEDLWDEISFTYRISILHRNYFRL